MPNAPEGVSNAIAWQLFDNRRWPGKGGQVPPPVPNPGGLSAVSLSVQPNVVPAGVDAQPIAIDLAAGTFVRLVATGPEDITLDAPTWGGPVSGMPVRPLTDGTLWVLEILNASGGAMGAITFAPVEGGINSPPLTGPDDGQAILGEFIYDAASGTSKLISGFTTSIADPPPVVGGTIPFDWTMVYGDPPGTSRTYAAGHKAEINIAPGAWPVGYKVSDGHTVGGVTPTGTNTGSFNIRICPPPAGTGRVKFITHVELTLFNPNNVGRAEFYVYIGTTNSSPGGKPMYPYLGVSHLLEPLHYYSADPGQGVRVICERQDAVDNNLLSDVPIATWPKWVMTPGSGLLYPATCPGVNNLGGVSVEIKDVYCFGYAC